MTLRINITGIVQGVGFRPFVANLAERLGINGTICNTGSGVEIFVQGDNVAIESFQKLLVIEAPSQSHIAEISAICANDADVYRNFSIIASEARSGIIFVPMDLSICGDCSGELFDPADRRYEYPFINCTQCGPRYSIIESLPYDRQSTTMNHFQMCDTCKSEYDTPSDRRYHAQPNACEECGPYVWIGDMRNIVAIKYAAELIDRGEIIAMRGLGGYHLICDATNDVAINELRRLKNRHTKPFAVMCDNPELLNVEMHVKEAIYSPQAPIVIFSWENHPLSKQINPLNDDVGVMRAYTPIHKLLLKYTKTDYIVATSGNRQDEPVCSEPKDAEASLSQFTKYFLHHNRPIKTRIDDSVAMHMAGELRLMRRGRGFAPFPISLGEKSNDNVVIFGAGAHLKNCITISKGHYAFVSQYLGDLDNAATLEFYQQTYQQMLTLLNCKTDIVACDKHQGYFSTEFANTLGIPTVQVQHHHAHMYATMAECGLRGDVIGVVMDGTGYGDDGAIWGGEFFVRTDREIVREKHINYIPQVAGDAAVKYPSRMAQSWLTAAGVWDGEYWGQRMGMANDIMKLNEAMLTNNINIVPTSSAGRLFESVGAMILGITSNEYEGHAAIALESIATNSNGNDLYDYDIDNATIIVTPMVKAIATDIQNGVPPSVISAKFHDTMAEIIHNICINLSHCYKIADVALAGGVFQNRRLLEQTQRLLVKSGLRCHIPILVPINDGGISLGQVYGVWLGR